MDRGFNLKIFSFLIKAYLIGIIFLPSLGLSYDYETHGYLTRETVKFYNQSFTENQLPQELLNFLIDGSRKEDDAPRWINHFYDPVYQRGYDPEMAIDAYPLVFAQTLKQVVSWVSSKQWAQDSYQQNRLVYQLTRDLYPISSILNNQEQLRVDFSESDFTWQKAKQYWLRGEKERAMFALGHILHLIQDASVPDHTRNDGHLGDSPYEKWSAQFNLNHADLELTKRLRSTSPVVLANLNEYFDSIAKYSNNNFYSKDTIGVSEIYSSPGIENVVLRNSRYYAIKLDEEKNNQFLFFYKKFKGSLILNLKTDVDLNDPYDFVLRDYWSRLSIKAVAHGAGVINLFFQEVAQEKPELEQPELNWYEKLWQWLTNQTNSLLGQLLPQTESNQTSNQGSQTDANREGSEQQDSLSLAPSLEPTPVLSSPLLELSPTLISVMEPAPTPVFSSLPSPVPSPSPTQALQLFIGNQTPNLPPSPSPEPSPISNQTPTPAPEISPSPTPMSEPSPILTAVPQSSPTPSPLPNYQRSNNQFFDEVAWYFDTEIAPEKGGVLTIELTVNQLPSEADYYAILAAWNSEFVKFGGAKAEGGDRPEIRYSLPQATGLLVNEDDPNFGPVISLWNYNGSFEPDRFPQKLKIRPTVIKTNQYLLIRKDLEQGISREGFEQLLGRQIGSGDFITMTLWPLYHQPTPAPDNTHYFGSFLTTQTAAISYPEPVPIAAIKNLRWGVDPSSETGYSLEFEYTLPMAEVIDQNSSGYELRFHLNGLADFYYGHDPNLGRPWFRGNDLSNLLYLNYGFYGSDVCDFNLRLEPKSGVRFYSDRCELNPFGRAAYNPNFLPHNRDPEADSWILKLPLLPSPAPKPFNELTGDDYLTVSLWVNESGPAAELALRQIDQRHWQFQGQYQPLEPTPSPSSTEPLLEVVINELAWMGTQASPYDEWLELYNNTTEEIDLTGWSLRSVEGEPEISLEGVIPVNGYFLLERTNEETISDLTADQLFTGAINDSCEVFELRDNLGRLQDRTSCDGGNWPAGEKESRSTMGRVDPTLPGEELGNWQTNDGITKNGLDAEGNEINGTPKQPNSGL